MKGDCRLSEVITITTGETTKSEMNNIFKLVGKMSLEGTILADTLRGKIFVGKIAKKLGPQKFSAAKNFPHKKNSLLQGFSKEVV